MFKDSFKYYKCKNPIPTFDHVVDFDKLEPDSKKVIKIPVQNEALAEYFGFKPSKCWEIYQLADKPGLLYIKNPFTCIGQRYWAVRCLKDFSKSPHKTNLDSLGLIPEGQNWWDLCKNNNDVLLMNKLRWATLGYHHNWDTKIYNEEDKSDFPDDLREMTAFVANVAGFSNFVAEAAIVNFYHMNSTLSGHIDHSEPNLEAPLLSVSFGQTAIFLIGGKTKEEKPLPIFLRSGDIIIMSKESRLCYHGVPKILQMDSRYWDISEEEVKCQVPESFKEIVKVCKNDEKWKPFGSYLTHARINLNVRQVLSRGQKRLNNENSYES